MHVGAWQQHSSLISPKKKDAVFFERVQIAGGWYDQWNDVQRKRFIKMIIDRSRGAQLTFMFDNLSERTRFYCTSDFAEVLPRHVSLRIFSYLDVFTLCRCSRVSWLWKCLTEDDSLWKPTCHPSKQARISTRYGNWKHLFRCHAEGEYISSATLPHMRSSGPGKKGFDDVDCFGGGNKSQRIGWRCYATKGTSPRKSWQYSTPRGPPSGGGRKGATAPSSPSSTNRNGGSISRSNSNGNNTVPRSRGELHKSKTATSPSSGSVGGVRRGNSSNGSRLTVSRRNLEGDEETSTGRKKKPNSKTSSASSNLPQPSDVHRQHVEENFLESGLYKRMTYKAGEEAGSGSIRYPPSVPIINTLTSPVTQADLGKDVVDLECPRILLISSKVQAPDLLLGGARFDIVSIPYDHDSTTLQILVARIKKALNGRKSESIGLFCHTEPGIIELTHESKVDIEYLKSPDIQAFFKKLVAFLAKNGRIDIFSSNVASSDEGLELIDRLERLTHTQFPTMEDITPNCLDVDTRGNNIVKRYFCPSKFTYWTSAAAAVDEAIGITKDNLHSMLRKHKRNIAKKLTGEIITKAMASSSLSALIDVTPELTEALQALSADNPENPKEYLVQYLTNPDSLNSKGAVKKGEKFHPTASYGTSKAKTLSLIHEVTLPSYSHRQQKKQGMECRRFQIAQELASSEEIYIRDLIVLQQVYVKPLILSLQNYPIISKVNIKLIFGDIESIASVSKQLMENLDSRVKTWGDQQCIGEVFLSLMGHFKVYTNFINNLPVALRTVDKCEQESSLFRAFLAQCRSKPETRGMDLGDYLNLPLKRVGSYLFLLGELMKYTPTPHMDFEHCKRSVAQMKDLIRYINDAKVSAERRRKMIIIQQKIANCPKIIEPHRRFIASNEFAELVFLDCYSNVPDETVNRYQYVQDVTLYLFNDILMVCQRTLQRRPFEPSAAAVDEYQTHVPIGSIVVSNINNNDDVRNIFKIEAPNKSWILQSSTSQEKEEWLNVMKTGEVRYNP
eukprot:Nk52_evm61s1401 gene=Nk52_evmTU61s1401